MCPNDCQIDLASLVSSICFTMLVLPGLTLCNESTSMHWTSTISDSFLSLLVTGVSRAQNLLRLLMGIVVALNGTLQTS